MKRIILLNTVFFCWVQLSISIEAQTLYGITNGGGSNNNGAIVKFLPASNNLLVARSFESRDENPHANLIQANDGKLYGMTEIGGSFGYGVIFSFDPSSLTYTKCKDFDVPDGVTPFGSLVQATDGKLYGMTSRGGNADNGTIFSFNPATLNYSKLKDFNQFDGGHPAGDLIQAGDGKLYGMTSDGGNGRGVIFSFDPAASKYIKLKAFSGGADGGTPLGSLMQAADGLLYGTTSNAGSGNVGVIFSFDIVSSAYVKLRDFRTFNGNRPRGKLIQAGNGKLYGTTEYGGSSGNGVIFSFDPATSNYIMLKEFNKTNGSNPYGGVMLASDGKLYGTTYKGGSNDLGVIYTFDLATATFSKLKDLANSTGSKPYGGLMQASDGLLYGMTSKGGAYVGVIYSLYPASSAYKKLSDFGVSSNGSSPSTVLMKAKNGKLYGTANYGGGYNSGVIFSFDPYSLVYKKVFDFDGTNGNAPNGGLVQADDGKLYGTTEAGGINNSGVIFSFDPLTSIYTTHIHFDGANGQNPFGGLFQASDGKFYGITQYGGTSDYGVFFCFDPVSLTYTKLKDFNGVNGANPSGNVVQASDGRLYGTTFFGGNNGYGVIFSYDPSTFTYKKLKDFNLIDGAGSFGSLIQASNGRLYGSTPYGGKGYGVIFSFDPYLSTYKKLREFNVSDGAFPTGSFIEASDGFLYGMTSRGGENDYGVIFSFNPASTKFKKLKSFDGANGAYPDRGAVFIEVKDTIVYLPPVVSLKLPADSATYLAGGNIYFSAIASDKDGTISKVRFYNRSTLLHTTTDTPYTFKWQNVHSANYILTARATDNSGLTTTSAPINISVVPNKAPGVSIISPANGEAFTALATINLEAAAADPDGRIIKVDFYNGATLLNATTERKPPYTYQWQNVPAGVYTITAVAHDNWGGVTTSALVTVTVTANGIVSSKPSSLNNKTNTKEAISLQLAPNPAKGIVNIYAKGLQKDKQTSLSIISASGVIMKTLKIAGSNQTIPLDVSSLSSGIYTIKIINGEKAMYRKFVKLSER